MGMQNSPSIGQTAWDGDDAPNWPFVEEQDDIGILLQVQVQLPPMVLGFARVK
jgi:hypothetical protein